MDDKERNNIVAFINRIMKDESIKQDFENMSRDEINILADYYICTYSETKSACKLALMQTNN